MIYRKIFFLLCIFTLSAVLNAQKIYFSNIPRLNNKAHYNKVIGENEGGIYILRFKDIDLKGGFSIDRYSHSLDFIENYNYALGKQEKLIKVFSFDSGLFLVKRTTEKIKTSISVMRIGFKLGELKGAKVVYSTTSFDRIQDNILVDFSMDRKTCVIWTEESDQYGNRLFICNAVNNRGDLMWTQKTNTFLPKREVAMEQISVSNSQSSALVFVYNRNDKRNSELVFEEYFFIQVAKNFLIPPHTITGHKFFISSYDMVFNEFKNEYLITGFFDFKKPKTTHGVMGIKFHPGDSVFHTNFKSLDRKFVAKLIGAKNEQEGDDPENFYLRRIIPRSDGGYLIIGEFFEITQQMETFYLNGVPQMSSKNMYNYNDILLVSIDSAGNIEWRHAVNKRQNSLYNLQSLQSIAVYVCENNVNLVYNDNTSQNNRIMHLSISRDGAIEQKILLNSENEYTAFIPTEGKQTGYDRYVAPLIQSRQISLIQLIENH